ncbi:hypothetical protein M406DRAFT_340149 [Cryphonectria parasitica EP155]|uniref:Uncharacterized protein n=1 Tax=Cryphonectria parasitica (strain ATCC 38755 / EP155) TaxID=660469 RepID=A0A9P4Y187_CRYP1|nr:uncharacterized protein M406DRAFT_340149 [Cryphonectria parasitica EP155]KAF3764575.1 hypothetical protein M406DRAFT_340149 [Cryphonectria parasitica EP155]
MASLSDLASHHHHHHSNKITKTPRGGKMVKPILKRLASSSSPKNSLDLDRGWEDQTVDLGYGGGNMNNNNSTYESSGRPSMSPSIRDVNFQFPPSWEPTGYGGGGGGGGVGVGVGGVGGGGSATGSGATTPVGPAGLEATSSSIHVGVTSSARNLSRGRYQHARSTSATSHVSIGTNGSNHRPGGGSFVHPFQQTPRTHTPPLTYANSFTSFERENNPARDYSPTIITENDDDDDEEHHHHHHRAGSASLSQSLAASSHLHRGQPSNSHSTTSLRRPSLASQRTSSLSDIRSHSNNNNNNNNNNNTHNFNPPLRVNTAPSFPRSVLTSSRLATHGSLSTANSNSNSVSDLHLNLSPTDSPRPSLHLASPTNSSVTAMSPLRSSMEGAFRLRSRSEVDMGARQDIREARRKFEENERIKQEKYEAEQRRKQERRQEKERAAAARKIAGGGGGENSPIIGRSSFSRRRSPPLSSTVSNASGTRRTRSGESAIHQHHHHHHRHGSAIATTTINEKAEGTSTGFLSSNYDSTADGAAPSFGQDVMDVRFETPKRTTTAKRKTQGYWTSFVLWFRTRLLKLGRR